MLPPFSILYATTSGNTEYVVDVLLTFLAKQKPDLSVFVRRVEEAKEDDLRGEGILCLACGTWNTGGREGQLNPHMDVLLHKRADKVDLAERQCLVIGLGDDRYKYTARATEHLATFINQHGGKLLVPPLVVVNDPYGQEKQIEKWGEKVLKKLSDTVS